MTGAALYSWSTLQDMRKAEAQIGRWQGFVVKKKIEGKPDQVVSGKFETTAGAQAYLELAQKFEPGGKFYVAEMIGGKT